MADLHGDPDALESILVSARLIDGTGSWSGGEARLVQLGDCIDRGPDSDGVLDRLERLAHEAAATRGEVVRLVGNHEMELMRGCRDYARGLGDIDGTADRLRRDAAEGRLRAAVTVGDWFCAHAGLRTWLRLLLEEEASATGHPEGIEGVVARANEILVEAARTGRFDHLLFGHRGLFWTYADTLVGSDRALEVPQVNGHTVRSAPFTRGHRALFADRGASAAMCDAPAYLEFEHRALRWYFRQGDGRWSSVEAPARPGSWPARQPASHQA